MYADVLPNYYTTVMSKQTFFMCKINEVSLFKKYSKKQEFSITSY